MPMICDYGEEFVPRRATIWSAGYDFFSPDDYDLKPNEWTVIDTGVRFDGDVCNRFSLDSMWFMGIVPRSGLSFKYGLRIINTVAIIDMDYRDTIKLKITVDAPYRLAKGDRFAQGILIPFGIFYDEIEPKTARIGGFGSTGV